METSSSNRWAVVGRKMGRFYLDILGYTEPDHDCYLTDVKEALVSIAASDLDGLCRLYEILRAEIKREDDLIDQRNTWCILVSAGILAALGAAGTIDADVEPWPKFLLGLAFIFSGAMVAFYCGRAVSAARMQIEYLFCTFIQNEGAFSARGFPRPFGRKKVHEKGVRYSQITPLILLHLWLCILLLWCAGFAYEYRAGVGAGPEAGAPKPAHVPPAGDSPHDPPKRRS